MLTHGRKPNPPSGALRISVEQPRDLFSWHDIHLRKTSVIARAVQVVTDRKIYPPLAARRRTICPFFRSPAPV